MPSGRLTVYTSQVADEICWKLSEGQSLRSICSADGMPSEAAVRLWVIDDRNGFAARYTRARDIGLDCDADSVVDIARAEKDPNRARVIIDAIKWRTCKLAPKKYGDRLEVAGDKDSPLTINVRRHDRE